MRKILGKAIYSSASGVANSLTFFCSKKAWEKFKKENKRERGYFKYLNTIELVEDFDVYVEDYTGREKLKYSTAQKLSILSQELICQIESERRSGNLRYATDSDYLYCWRYVVKRNDESVAWESDYVIDNVNK